MLRICLLLLLLSMAKASVKMVSSRGEGSHPSSMELEVELPATGQSVRLPLSRSEALENVAMSVISDDGEQIGSANDYQHPDHAHYTNFAAKSVMSYKQANGEKKFEGHFMHDGKVYFVKPLAQGHNISEGSVPELQQQAEQNKMQFLSRSRRQTFVWNTQYIAEVDLHLDCAVYQKYVKDYGSQAMWQLHYAYTHVLNGMNVVFRYANQYGLSLSVRALVMIVEKSSCTVQPSSSKLSHEQGVQQLVKLKKYREAMTRKADHLLAFTANHFDGFTGLAYGNTVCDKASSVSFTTDYYIHSWRIGSHELAHSMGAPHDGDKNNCDYNKGYIMGAWKSLNIYTDEAHFSRCSVENMKTLMAKLNAKREGNCLTQKSGVVTKHLQNSYAPGLIGILAWTCRKALKRNDVKFVTDRANLEYFHRNPSLLCSQIRCVDNQNKVHTSHDRAAFEDVPCGNRKLCKSGICRYKFKGYAANEKCMLGDIGDAADCRRRVDNLKRDLSQKSRLCPSLQNECCATVDKYCFDG